MARILLNEEEVGRILAANKRIGGNLDWQYSQREGYAKCELSVASSMGVNLKIVANVNMEEPSLYSFSLILSNAYNIRRLDVNTSHRNKHSNAEKWWSATHKHRWTDRCRDSFAYTPQESIHPPNIDETFRTFCDECNIAFNGSVSPLPPKQLNMKL